MARALRTGARAVEPDDQELIVARVEMGGSYEELAESLGKPTQEAARKAAKRALVRLAEEMARDGDDPLLTTWLAPCSTAIRWTGRTLRPGPIRARHPSSTPGGSVARSGPAPSERVRRVRATERDETWGHLRLLERIGRGAFGEVYRAWDTPSIGKSH